jgi:hypothetical protein
MNSVREVIYVKGTKKKLVNSVINMKPDEKYYSDTA